MRFAHLFNVLLVSILFPQLVHAITISASPNPAVPNQSVNVRITANFAPPDPCSLQVNFGDGSGWQPAGNCGGVTNCVLNVITSYGAAGNYQIQARSSLTPGACVVPPSGPNPASYTLTVAAPGQPQPPPGQPQPPFQAGEELPIGIAGVVYDHQLTTQGAKGATTFQLVFGELPPGLRLSPRGKITGIPTLEGEFPFRLKISDQSGQSIEQQYLLLVGQAVLSVTVDPGQQTIARNREGSYGLRYNFTSSEPVDDTIRSSQGVFYAGNRKVGVSNTNLTATMRRGRAQASETVVVPLSILQMVQRGGLSEIRYERVFSADYMKAKTTSSIVIPVGIGFSITELRIYFGNNEGKTIVKRNESDIEAFADIRYEGSGTLEGYWEADGRILKTLKKELRYSRDKVITLGLLDIPKGPPLPTYSFGSHRLRFVITKPRLNITFPEAIYMVSSEGLAEQFPIVLDAPADNERLGRADLLFTWQKKLGITAYKVAFYVDKDKPPFFETFTKAGGYRIPTLLADRHFADNGTYWWMVSGYDADDELSAQSRMFSFYLFNDPGNVNE